MYSTLLVPAGCSQDRKSDSVQDRFDNDDEGTNKQYFFFSREEGPQFDGKYDTGGISFKLCF
jgi:hypothetical protein